MNIQRATYFDAPKMNTQSKPNCKVESIGDIGLTKAETTLHIVTDAVPAKVFDKNDTLICFYAKQVMTAFDGTEITAMKENQRHNEPTTVSVDNDVLAKAKENYWYFFSPLYFGESPVACMTSPQWQDGKGIIRIYTFKRMHSQQSVSNISGYFGERIYLHGYLVHSPINTYQYYRVASEDKLFLVGTAKRNISVRSHHAHGCVTPNMLCTCMSCRMNYEEDAADDVIVNANIVEFFKPEPSQEGNAPNILISMDESTNSMTVAKGFDLMEAILLCCACFLYNKCLHKD